MCNLSQGIYEQGIEKGIEQGRELGYVINRRRKWNAESFITGMVTKTIYFL